MSVRRIYAALCLAPFVAIAAPAQNTPAAPQAPAHVTTKSIEQLCPRPSERSDVPEPHDLRSENGVLKVELTFHGGVDVQGQTRFCYTSDDGSLAPNLRLHPGDTLILLLKNEASLPASAAVSMPAMDHASHHASSTSASADPCNGGPMIASSTNLHFHGLVIPPVCHQDETLNTRIQADSAPFEFRFQIPRNTPPGLYWYHPHPHGFSKLQVIGGASGALIVEGVEGANPAVAGLPERVFVVRDQDLVNPNAQPVQTDSVPPPIVLRDAEGDAINTGTGTGKPAKDLSINFVPVPFPRYDPAVLRIKPGEKQFWRVLNAAAITYLDLQVLVNGKPQMLGVVSLDGVPIDENDPRSRKILQKSHILLPPAGRVEFIVKGPAIGEQASFVTRTVDTGPAGENDPTRPLAMILASNDTPEPHARLPLAPPPPNTGKPEALVASLHAVAPSPAPPAWLGTTTPVRERKFYFSEEPQDPKDPNSPTKFYITLEGETPKVFDPAAAAPNITANQGDVEDWIIENRSTELHAFHIHQVHFLLLEWNGVPVDEPYLRDTINVAYWDGHSSDYPRVKLRMDFRDPRIVGTFMYHCHLLEHEDGGMMGTIRVVGAENRASSALQPNTALRPNTDAPRTQ